MKASHSRGPVPMRPPTHQQLKLVEAGGDAVGNDAYESLVVVDGLLFCPYPIVHVALRRCSEING